MADWKQITARIRRARGSKDPAGQLGALFEKTRDAMVAFELGRHFETTKQNEDAIKWYSTAYSRFRRGDWKSKSQEAIVRLGGEVPSAEEPAAKVAASSAESEIVASGPAFTIPEPGLPFEQNAEAFSALVESSSEVEPSAPAANVEASGEQSPDRKGRRRRGRRGGRNRKKSGPVPAGQQSQSSPDQKHSSRPVPSATRGDIEIQPPRVVDSRSIPRLPVEASSEALGVGPKGRFGDPGLSSRLSLLEMQFRRLLTCAPVKLSEADRAPAGPGVFVLTDDDMTTYYYVEACDTLRVAVGNMARGGSSRRGAPSIKPQMADHLGIPEAQVSKYLEKHCVVRWLQLDEGAQHFAHFVISVLRPSLNE